MRLSHSVRIDRPAGEVGTALCDLGRAVPYLPGAHAVAPAAEGVTGMLEVRVGRLPLTYRGRVRLLATDERGVTVRARGREEHGNGDADAYLTAGVRDDSGGAVLELDLQLDLRGKAAVLGRGTVADLAADLVAGFAENLAADLARPARPAATVATVAAVERRPVRTPRPAVIAAAGAAVVVLGLGVRALVRRRTRS